MRTVKVAVLTIAIAQRKVHEVRAFIVDFHHHGAWARPGAVVVEIDDESPDFVHLPLSYSDGEDGDFDGPHAGPDGYGRRDDLAARRAG